MPDDPADVCDVCRERYGDAAQHPRAPVALACGHVFCKLCVARMLLMRVESAGQTSSLTCPFRCHTTTLVNTQPEGDDAAALTAPIAGKIHEPTMLRAASVRVTNPMHIAAGAASAAAAASQPQEVVLQTEAAAQAASPDAQDAQAAPADIPAPAENAMSCNATGTLQPRPSGEPSEVTADDYAAVVCAIRSAAEYDGRAPAGGPIPVLVLLPSQYSAFSAFGDGARACCAFLISAALSTFGFFMAVRAPLTSNVLADSSPPWCALVPMACVANAWSNSTQMCTMSNMTWYALARPMFVDVAAMPSPGRAVTDVIPVPPQLGSFIANVDAASCASAVSLALMFIILATCCCGSGQAFHGWGLLLGIAKTRMAVTCIACAAALIAHIHGILGLLAHLNNRQVFCSAFCNFIDARLPGSLCVNMLTDMALVPPLMGDRNTLLPTGKYNQMTFQFVCILFSSSMCLLIYAWMLAATWQYIRRLRTWQWSDASAAAAHAPPAALPPTRSAMVV